jgi:hypothetical protein
MAEELSCLRRHRRPGNIAEVRRPRLCKGKRCNSAIISSMFASPICRRLRRATGSIVSVTGSICRENTYDEFRGQTATRSRGLLDQGVRNTAAGNTAKTPHNPCAPVALKPGRTPHFYFCLHEHRAAQKRKYCHGRVEANDHDLYGTSPSSPLCKSLPCWIIQPLGCRSYQGVSDGRRETDWQTSGRRNRVSVRVTPPRCSEQPMVEAKPNASF